MAGAEEKKSDKEDTSYNNQLWARLSRSSKTALKWAAAYQEPLENTAQGIFSENILRGIIVAHRMFSEPKALLKFIYKDTDDLEASITKIGGYVPPRIPKQEVPLSGMPLLSDNSRRIIESGLELAEKYGAPGNVARIRDLFGGILQNHNSIAFRSIINVLEQSSINIKEVLETYPRFLITDEKTRYLQFLTENIIRPEPPPKTMNESVREGTPTRQKTEDNIGTGEEGTVVSEAGSTPPTSGSNTGEVFPATPSPVRAIALTPENEFIISGHDDYTVRIRDFASVDMTRILYVHEKAITSLTVSPDGKYVISGSEDSTILLWDLKEGKVKTLPKGHRGSVSCLAATLDNNYIISGSSDSTLMVRDLKSEKSLRYLNGHMEAITDVAVTGDSKRIISASADLTIKIWDLESGNEIRTLEGSTSVVTCLAVSPDDKQIILGSEDFTIKIWDIDSGELVRSIYSLKSAITSIAVTPDGKYIISGSADSMIIVWDIVSGKPVMPLGKHKDAITCLAVTSDSRYVVSGSEDTTIETSKLEVPQILGFNIHPSSKFLSDQWSSKDYLGHKAIADAITSLITDQKINMDPPFTIGIKSAWGTGKTSIMKMVQYALDDKAKIIDEKKAMMSPAGKTSIPETTFTLKDLLKEIERMSGKETGRTSLFGRLLNQAKTLFEKSPLPDIPLNRVMGAFNRNRTHKSAEMEEIPLGMQMTEDKRLTIWFNAWKYQTSEQIWAGLAHCIIKQLTDRMSSKERERFWLRRHLRRISASQIRDEAKRELYREYVPRGIGFGVGVALCVAAAVVLTQVPNIASNTPAIVGGGGGGTSIIGGAFEYIRKRRAHSNGKVTGDLKKYISEPDYESRLGFLHVVDEDVRDIVKDVASPEKPLVIFIDDLDRCAPSKVSEVVEAVNVFLSGDIPNCVFVLGLEPSMVAAALEISNKELMEEVKDFTLKEDHTPTGWRYMEKIVQLPVSVPPPTEKGLENFVRSIFIETEESGSAKEKNQDMDQNIKSVETDTHRRIEGNAGPGKPPSPPDSGNRKTKVKEKQEKEDKPVNNITQEQNGSDVEAGEKYDENIDWDAVKERLVMSINLDAFEEGLSQILDDHPSEQRKQIIFKSKEIWIDEFNKGTTAITKFWSDVLNDYCLTPRRAKRCFNVFKFMQMVRTNIITDYKLEQEEKFPFKMPTDEVLTKYAVMCIEFPQAVDCMNTVAPLLNGNGKEMLIYMLEEKAKEFNLFSDEKGAATEWQRFLENAPCKSSNLGNWGKSDSFREFLATGVSLAGYENCGLW